MSKTVRAPGTLAATGLSPCTLSREPLTLWVTCTGRPLGARACGEGPSCQHFRPDAQLPLLTLTQERRTLPEPDGRRIDLVALVLKYLALVFFLKKVEWREVFICGLN